MGGLWLQSEPDQQATLSVDQAHCTLSKCQVNFGSPDKYMSLPQENNNHFQTVSPEITC